MLSRMQELTHAAVNAWGWAENAAVINNYVRVIHHRLPFGY